ncbi:unnamed protein product [Amoebophrya sp. A120]|nr:unnamed protein product [Amoebophrya sp. A120]|eukprot:GSA120T00013362001.1
MKMAKLLRCAFALAPAQLQFLHFLLQEPTYFARASLLYGFPGDSFFSRSASPASGSTSLQLPRLRLGGRSPRRQETNSQPASPRTSRAVERGLEVEETTVATRSPPEDQPARAAGGAPATGAAHFHDGPSPRARHSWTETYCPDCHRLFWAWQPDQNGTSRSGAVTITEETPSRQFSTSTTPRRNHSEDLSSRRTESYEDAFARAVLLGTSRRGRSEQNQQAQPHAYQSGATSNSNYNISSYLSSRPARAAAPGEQQEEHSELPAASASRSAAASSTTTVNSWPSSVASFPPLLRQLSSSSGPATGAAGGAPSTGTRELFVPHRPQSQTPRVHLQLADQYAVNGTTVSNLHRGRVVNEGASLRLPSTGLVGGEDESGLGATGSSEVDATIQQGAAAAGSPQSRIPAPISSARTSATTSSSGDSLAAQAGRNILRAGAVSLNLVAGGMIPGAQVGVTMLRRAGEHFASAAGSSGVDQAVAGGLEASRDAGRSYPRRGGDTATGTSRMTVAELAAATVRDLARNDPRFLAATFSTFTRQERDSILAAASGTTTSAGRSVGVNAGILPTTSPSPRGGNSGSSSTPGSYGSWRTTSAVDHSPYRSAPSSGAAGPASTILGNYNVGGRYNDGGNYNRRQYHLHMGRTTPAGTTSNSNPHAASTSSTSSGQSASSPPRGTSGATTIRAGTPAAARINTGSTTSRAVAVRNRNSYPEQYCPQCQGRRTAARNAVELARQRHSQMLECDEPQGISGASEEADQATGEPPAEHQQHN